MRRGFTLVEVLVVVIILGILAAIGIPQLNKAIEKSRGAEARIGFGLIRTAQGEYYAKNDYYAGIGGMGGAPLNEAQTEAVLGIDLPDQYWSWEMISEIFIGGGPNWTAIATRKSGPWAGDTYTIDHNGIIGGNWEFAQ